MVVGLGVCWGDPGWCVCVQAGAYPVYGIPLPGRGHSRQVARASQHTGEALSGHQANPHCPSSSVQPLSVSVPPLKEQSFVQMHHSLCHAPQLSRRPQLCVRCYSAPKQCTSMFINAAERLHINTPHIYIRSSDQRVSVRSNILSSIITAYKPSISFLSSFHALLLLWCSIPRLAAVSRLCISLFGPT